MNCGVDNQEAESGQDVESGCNTSKPGPSDPLPTVRFHLRKGSAIFNRISPAGDRVFTHFTCKPQKLPLASALKWEQLLLFLAGV